MLWKIKKKIGRNKEQIKKNIFESFKNTNSKCRVHLLALMECTVIFITIGALCQSS